MILPHRIVLFGVSKSGKSSLGDRLRDRHEFAITAFADPLKEACKVIFGFSDEDLWGPSERRETCYPAFRTKGFCFTCQQDCSSATRAAAAKLWTVEERPEAPDYFKCTKCGWTSPGYATPRTALQTLGTEWGRQYCHDLWADACFRRMDPARPYVVTDGRFKNERDVARRKNACTVILMRGMKESTSPHPSEAEVRAMLWTPHLFDIVLDNREGTADENFGKLLSALERIYKDKPRHTIEWGER